MRSALLATLPLALAACHDDDDCCDGGGGIPVFEEQERNDDPLTANHFGVIHPGDHFFIDGFVRDDLADPFDGFAFTAGSALHVDFQLFIGNPAADLDVCLYDPQIDQTVACFATDNDPEQGGVDVFAAGLDFHLVVESFVGDASYSLEIVVLPLFVQALHDGTGLAAVAPRADHATEALDGYRVPQRGPLFLLEHVLEIDEETGIVLETWARRGEL